jgi:hypothetical protein
MKKLLLMGLITLGTSTMAFACPPDKACPVGPQSPGPGTVRER